MKLYIWRGVEYKSWEQCKVQTQPDGYTVESLITGNHFGKIFNVKYVLRLDKRWSIQNFEIHSEIDGAKDIIKGIRNGEDWEINDIFRPEFRGLLCIDISLTPFTNSLPINNLMLMIDQSFKINVIYIDILNKNIRRVNQRYTRKSKYEYFYENYDTNFISPISVDRNGIVRSYPNLFELVSEGINKNA